jgi:hypothetical protein
MLDLIKANLKDASVYDVIYKSVVTRARISAIVLGSFMIVALLAVVYAFVQQTAAQKLQVELTNRTEQVRLVELEAKKQAALAMEARLIAEEANKMALEQLKEKGK